MPSSLKKIGDFEGRVRGSIYEKSSDKTGSPAVFILVVVALGLLLAGIGAMIQAIFAAAAAITALIASALPIVATLLLLGIIVIFLAGIPRRTLLSGFWLAAAAFGSLVATIFGIPIPAFLKCPDLGPGTHAVKWGFITSKIDCSGDVGPVVIVLLVYFLLGGAVSLGSLFNLWLVRRSAP